MSDFARPLLLQHLAPTDGVAPSTEVGNDRFSGARQAATGRTATFDDYALSFSTEGR